MKATDFTIGDLVFVKPSMLPIKVVAIHQRKVGYHAVNHKLNWVRIELLEPIPLTSGILERNGFMGEGYAILKLDENSWLEYYYHEHRLRKYWVAIDEWLNHSEVKDLVFQCHCYYVHELQHALRQCEIEKEVVL